MNAAYAATTHFKYDTMWNGVDEIVPFIDIPSSGRFHVIAARMNMPCCSNSLTQDRGLSQRTGGRQLSELICFSRDLSEEERMAVTRYLQDKWGVTDGELHIDVDENDNSVNDSVAIEGSLKVVKKVRERSPHLCRISPIPAARQSTKVRLSSAPRHIRSALAMGRDP